MRQEANAVSKRLDATIEARGKAVAYRFRGRAMTFDELGTAVQRAAGALDALGIEPGDRVGVMLRNCPEFFVMSQAIWRAGAVMVPVNVLWSEHEVGHLLRDSGMRLLIVSADLAERAAAARGDEDVTLVVAGEETAADRALTYRELLGRGTDSFVPRAPRADRLSIIAYTSGTSGMAKGAMLDDGHLFDWMENIEAHLDLGESDNFLQFFPVHSVAPGIIGGWLTAFIGSECVILERFDVAEVARTVSTYRVTCFAMVPTMLLDLLRHDFETPPDFSSLRYIQAGGAAVPDRIRTQLDERWGIPMIKSYGSTECNFVSLDRVGVIPVEGASGQLMPHLDVTARGENGDVLPAGEPGEICVGPRAGAARPFRPILGYWNAPEVTAEALADGVFHTGDIGYVDDDGFLFVVDRLKDMLIRGGNNIYPAELENALHADPRVEHAYVVGIRDPRLGEVPKAYIVLCEDAGDCTAEELVTQANSRLARYKRIDEAELIASEDLPRNAMNKVLKRELAERANAGRAVTGST